MTSFVAVIATILSLRLEGECARHANATGPEEMVDICADSNDAMCIVNRFCREAGIDCDAILRSLVAALSSTGTGSAVSYTTIFVAVIILLKLVIVALSWLIAKLHCQRRRDRKRDKDEALVELREIDVEKR